MFINVIDGQYVKGYNLLLLQKDFPHANFSIDFLREDNPSLADYNVVVCRQLSQPSVDFLTQNVTPKDPEFINGEWVQDWVVTDKTAEEKRNIVPVVTMNRAKKALQREGKLEAINDAVAAIGGEAALDWEYSIEVHRESPLVLAFTSQLGWTEDEVNELFQLAVTL